MIKKRKHFEYKLQKRTKEKEDILSYIQYETSLLHLIGMRREVRFSNKNVSLEKKAFMLLISENRLWTQERWNRFCHRQKNQQTLQDPRASILWRLKDLVVTHCLSQPNGKPNLHNVEIKRLALQFDSFAVNRWIFWSKITVLKSLNRAFWYICWICFLWERFSVW